MVLVIYLFLVLTSSQVVNLIKTVTSFRKTSKEFKTLQEMIFGMLTFLGKTLVYSVSIGLQLKQMEEFFNTKTRDRLYLLIEADNDHGRDAGEQEIDLAERMMDSYKKDNRDDIAGEVLD